MHNFSGGNPSKSLQACIVLNLPDFGKFTPSKTKSSPLKINGLKDKPFLLGPSLSSEANCWFQGWKSQGYPPGDDHIPHQTGKGKSSSHMPWVLDGDI